MGPDEREGRGGCRVAQSFSSRYRNPTLMIRIKASMLLFGSMPGSAIGRMASAGPWRDES